MKMQAADVQRLWQAVLLLAVCDWLEANEARKCLAEQYLFEDRKDFQLVCASAGLSMGAVRRKLQDIRTQSREGKVLKAIARIRF